MSYLEMFMKYRNKCEFELKFSFNKIKDVRAFPLYAKG